VVSIEDKPAVDDVDDVNDVLDDEDMKTFAEQIKQDDLFDEWIKDPSNSAVIGALEEPWFAWRDGKVIATGTTLVEVHKGVEAFGVDRNDAHVQRTAKPTLKALSHPFGIKQIGTSRISDETIPCTLDFCDVAGATPSGLFEQTLSFDTGADVTSLSPFIIRLFVRYIKKRREALAAGKKVFPVFGHHTVVFAVRDGKKTRFIEKLEGVCWLKIGPAKQWMQIPFSVDKTLDSTYQQLLGREGCIDAMEFKWVGIRATDLSARQHQYTQAEKGHLTILTLD